MKFRNMGWAAGMALAVLWSASAAPVQAQNALAGGGTDASAAKSSKKQKAGKSASTSGNVKFLPGSGETRSERATRLKRECKGRVNAGACEGYAS